MCGNKNNNNPERETNNKDHPLLLLLLSMAALTTPATQLMAKSQTATIPCAAIVKRSAEGLPIFKGRHN